MKQVLLNLLRLNRSKPNPTLPTKDVKVPENFFDVQGSGIAPVPSRGVDKKSKVLESKKSTEVIQEDVNIENTNNMKLRLDRFVDDGDTSFSILFINGVFQCFIVEDQENTIKKYGETRIPNGIFDVSLRSSGSFHTRYLAKFGKDFHKGMLCISNAPNWKIIQGATVFQYVLMHIGNSDDDTAGCILPNTSVNSSTMRGSGSTTAYKKAYPIITNHLLSGGTCQIEIRDIEHGR